jgi:hypothetical protein
MQTPPRGRHESGGWEGRLDEALDVQEHPFVNHPGPLVLAGAFGVLEVPVLVELDGPLVVPVYGQTNDVVQVSSRGRFLGGVLD